VVFSEIKFVSDDRSVVFSEIKFVSDDRSVVFSEIKFVREALKRRRKDWLARIQDSVSEWSDMSTCELLFQ
jgi:hypothetical protein